jgi:hypothetical protein
VAISTTLFRSSDFLVSPFSPFLPFNGFKKGGRLYLENCLPTILTSPTPLLVRSELSGLKADKAGKDGTEQPAAP